MGHRINVILDDAVWEQLKTIPSGERSRLVNASVSFELLRRQRSAAAAALVTLRGQGAHVGVAAEALLRSDREAHECRG